MDSQIGKKDSELICSSLRDFFNDRLVAAAQKNRVELSVRLIDYVTELLVGFQDSEKLFFQESAIPVLAEMMAEAIDADNSRRVMILKQMGDTSLMLSGYFPEALERRCMNLSYYHRMGETAYGLLGTLSEGMSVYDELSQRFPKVCGVLNEMSEATQDRTYSIDRLLEIYRNSSSERALEKLRKQGIIPFDIKKDPSIS